MRIPQLNIVRFVLSSAIVIWHFGRTIYPFDQPVLSTLFRFANFGVSFFFLLSGFVMVIAYHDENKSSALDKEKYWVNRLARIYPVYLLSMALYFISTLLVNPEVIKPLPIVLNVLLLQAWTPTFTLYMNGPAWALSVQVFCYAIFPYVLPALARMSTSRLLRVVTAFWALSLFVYVFLFETIYRGAASFAHDLIFYNPLLHLNSFIVGVGGGLIFKRMPTEGNSYIPGLYMLFSGVCMAALVLAPNPVIGYGHNGLLAPLGIIFIIGLARDRSVLSRLLAKRQVMLLGELSYGIYILHGPLRKLVMYQYTTHGVTWSPPVKYLVYLILLAMLSIASYYLIEQPVRKIIKKGIASPVR